MGSMKVKLSQCTHLNGATLGNQLILHVIVPQAPVCQVFQQVGIDNLRRERKHLKSCFFQFMCSSCVRSPNH